MNMYYVGLLVLLLNASSLLAAEPQRLTKVAIKGEQFFLNGQPTYAGRMWEGKRIEGLLFNSRMVQAIFDDRNPVTRSRWVYPDTKQWDPDRNTAEFIEMLPEWRRHGLLAVDICLQGGSPEGYSKSQPWKTAVSRARPPETNLAAEVSK